jgi:hypothetical protein
LNTWIVRSAWTGAALAAVGLAGCGKPDVNALQRLGCEQAATNVDLQSVQQLDTLRKALGVAPDVDPVAFCESIGARMTPAPAETTQSGEAQPDGDTAEN